MTSYSISSLSAAIISRMKKAAENRNIGYLPRWVVLTIDMTIVAFCTLVTFKILSEMGLNYMDYSHLWLIGAIFFTLHLLFFWLLRTYLGIIRHSSFIDAVKIFIALFLVLVFQIIANYVSYFSLGVKLFMNAGLFINFTLSFCSLLIYRVLVKQSFDVYHLSSHQDNLMPALIFGADANAIAVATALKSEKPIRFRVVGFVDKESQNSSKRVLNLPIFDHRGGMNRILSSSDAEALIIADKSLTKEERLAIVDECLEFNYKVYTVPIISDWENRKEISKKVTNFKIQDLLERKPIVLDGQAISAQLSGKTVLITGAAGSIGSEITKQVIGYGPRLVILLDQAETPLHNLRLEIAKLDTPVMVKSLIADIRDRNHIEKVFAKGAIDVVYHAAAYKHVPLMEENPAQAIYVNVMGTKNLADLACKYNVESFVMVSTDKAVNPSNVMGASKRIAEKYVRALFYKMYTTSTNCSTRFITTRFGNVLGSNGSVVPLFTQQIAEGGPVTITHPDIIRYFMTIPEACQLVLEAGAMGKGGEIFIFDMGKPVKILDLAKKMISLAGFTPDKEIKIEIVGLRPGEKLYEELLNNSAKTLPTHHEKIMIAEDVTDDYDEILYALEDMIDSASRDSKNTLVSKMKAIVPEFISMNSNYELLDNL